MWQLRQQDHLHHRDQEIPPIEETRSLPPLSLAGPSPGVSVLPSPPPPPSLSWAHLTSVTSVWSLVASRFGSGDLPGMGGVSADPSPRMGRGEHNQELHLQDHQGQVCPLPAQDPRYPSTSGPNSCATWQQLALQAQDRNHSVTHPPLLLASIHLWVNL